MGFRITNNISALAAQGNLQKTNQSLNKTLNRLVTGLRINSGADDAAGLAISSQLSSQIRSFGKASANIQDGISLLQTAEGGLSNTGEDLQRLRELTVQAGNGALTDEDRAAIEQEASALLENIDDTANRTEFNTKSLLDGSTAGRARVQGNSTEAFVTGEVTQGGNFTGTVSASRGSDGNLTRELTVTGNGESRTVSIDDNGRARGAIDGVELQFKDLEAAEVEGQQVETEDVVTLENAATATFTDADGDAVNVNIAAGNSTLDDVVSQLNTDFAANNVDLTATIDDNGDITVAGNNVGEDFTVSGANADFSESFGIQNGITSAADATSRAERLGNTNDAQVSQGVQFDAAVSFDVSDGTGAATTVNLGGAGTVLTEAEIQDSINTQLQNGGQDIQAEFSDGQLSLESNAVGADAEVTIIDTSAGAQDLQSALGVSDQTARGSGDTNITVNLQRSGLNFQTGANQVQRSQFSFGDFSRGGLGLGEVGLQSQEGRDSFLSRLDSAIDRVSIARSSIGAQSNRFQSQFNNLGNVTTNLTAANSQIADADFAVETTALAQQQLLNQAGVGLLAQANLRNSSVLGLLGG